MTYPENSKHVLKKSGYSQLTDGNEIYPGLHTALMAELGMQPMSLNAAWFSLPRATMSHHHRCHSVSINAAEPQTSFIPDHLPFHMPPVIVMKSSLGLVTVNKDLAVLGQGCRRASRKRLQHPMPSSHGSKHLVSGRKVLVPATFP